MNPLRVLSILTLLWASHSSAVELECKVDRPSVSLPALPEASGIASSRRTPGLLWSHADSGNAPMLIALDSHGAMKGQVRLNGARPVDWEDVAVGPCGSTSCVYAADIGDNDARRANVTVYRAPEPLATDAATAPVEAFKGRFPDGSNDAEAFFVLGGDMFIVTKGATGPVALYRFPPAAKASEVATLQKVGVLQGGRVTRPHWVTGASASLDGRWVALRSPASVALYDATKLVKGDFSSPASIPLSGLKEVQGEGVALGEKGAVFLVGEGGGKRAPGVLGALACDLPS